MSLAITSRIVSGVVIVDMSGRLCAREVALRAYINQLREEGRRAFVLNFADVPYIDSFGLGLLVTIWTSIQSVGGQLILLNPTDHIRKLLEITKLDSVFQTSCDETEAVRSAHTSLVAV